MQALMDSCFAFNVVSVIERSVRWNPRTVKGGTVLSKDPTGYRNVGPFLRLDPSLHVLMITRDPRDMVVSTHKSRPDGYWCNLNYWKESSKFYRKFKDHPRLCAIRYEELVQSPDQIQEEIMRRFTFLQRKQLFSCYHQQETPLSRQIVQAMHGVSPISAKSIGRWRQHLPRVAGQLRIYGDISRDLIEFGFEKDDAWLRQLQGVTPDLSGDQTDPELPRDLDFHLETARECLRVLLRRCGMDRSPIRGEVEQFRV
jgi:hypothetical protein